MLESTLPFGRLVDVGMREYGEFACSRETADMLIAGGMRVVDGRPVQVAVVDCCENSPGADNVICHVYFDGVAA